MERVRTAPCVSKQYPGQFDGIAPQNRAGQNSRLTASNHISSFSHCQDPVHALEYFSILSFDNIVVNSADKQLHIDGKSKSLFVISSKCWQISVQFSNFEHQFVILPIRIARTPYKGSRDDSQVKDEVTHRSAMTRLTGRQRQWLTAPVTSTMTHRSTHPLGNLSPQTRHAFDTVERSSLSWELLRCNACGACNPPTQ